MYIYVYIYSIICFVRFWIDLLARKCSIYILYSAPFLPQRRHWLRLRWRVKIKGHWHDVCLPKKTPQQMRAMRSSLPTATRLRSVKPKDHMVK